MKRWGHLFKKWAPLLDLSWYLFICFLMPGSFRCKDTSLLTWCTNVGPILPYLSSVLILAKTSDYWAWVIGTAEAAEAGAFGSADFSFPALALLNKSQIRTSLRIARWAQPLSLQGIFLLERESYSTVIPLRISALRMPEIKGVCGGIHSLWWVGCWAFLAL